VLPHHHTPPFNPVVPAKHDADRFRIDAVFLLEYPRRERFHRVAVQYGNGGLNDDGAGIQVLVHKMNRAPGDLDAVLQRLALRIQAGKAGSSEGWMLRMRLDIPG